MSQEVGVGEGGALPSNENTGISHSLGHGFQTDMVLNSGPYTFCLIGLKKSTVFAENQQWSTKSPGLFIS